MNLTSRATSDEPAGNENFTGRNNVRRSMLELIIRATNRGLSVRLVTECKYKEQNKSIQFKREISRLSRERDRGERSSTVNAIPPAGLAAPRGAFTSSRSRAAERRQRYVFRPRAIGALATTVPRKEGRWRGTPSRRRRRGGSGRGRPGTACEREGREGGERRSCYLQRVATIVTRADRRRAPPLLG